MRRWKRLFGTVEEDCFRHPGVCYVHEDGHHGAPAGFGGKALDAALDAIIKGTPDNNSNRARAIKDAAKTLKSAGGHAGKLANAATFADLIHEGGKDPLVAGAIAGYLVEGFDNIFGDGDSYYGRGLGDLINQLNGLPTLGPNDGVFARGSPLVLDLDGDGVEAGGLTFFDHEKDGFMEMSRWAGKDDGVLVWDRNGDGVINDGTELFGNNTVLSGGGTAAHGFAALADLDTNADGKVDASDAGFGNLRVMRWVDSDNDGQVDAGERQLSTLGSLNIRSLETGFRNSSKVDSFGNSHRQIGGYTLTNGTRREMTDVWFRTYNAATVYNSADIPAHSDAIKNLPDILGSGRVYDLRDAMALDDAGKLKAPFYSNTRAETRSLRQLVAAFKSTTSKSSRETLADKILHRWAGAEGATDGDYWMMQVRVTTVTRTRNWRGRLRISRSTSIKYVPGVVATTTGTKMAVVEAFQGEKWLKEQSYRRPANITAQKFNQIYGSIRESLYGRLMLQTHLLDLANGISVSLKEGARADSVNLNDYEISFAGAERILAGENNARRSEFLRSLAAVNGQNGWFVSQMRAGAASWVYEYTYHAEYLADGIAVDGHSRGSVINGDSGVNVFRTTDNKNDTLRGGRGNDIYHLNSGTGRDRIEEAGGIDAVKIAPDTATSRVVIARTRNNLHVSLLDSNGNISDSIVVAGHYSNPAARVENIFLGDGTVWNGADGEYIDPTSGNDIVDVAGGDVSDTLNGYFGGGNDTLRGGRGGDVYLFGAGSDNDIVDDAFRNTLGSNGDIVRLEASVAASNVSLSRNKTDLIISLRGGGGTTVTDTLTVRNHFVYAAARIERVELSNGALVWDAAAFAALHQQDATGGNDYVGVIGGNVADILSGFRGGNDTLRGGNGADVYMFGAGSDNDVIEEAFRNFGSDGDIVRLKSGITASQLSLSRNKTDLIVSLRAGGGTAVTDTMTVRDYYVNSAARIERVELSDGTLVWGASQLNAVSWTAPAYTTSTTTIRGGAGGDNLYGAANVNDIFDADAGGNDGLYGYGGDDVYYLGAGTGHDAIREHANNSGDAGDEIRLKSGIAVSSVTLERVGVGVSYSSGEHLHIQLRDGNNVITDSLTVEYYYTDASARVESVVFGNGTIWGAAEFDAVRIYGKSGDENIYGLADRNDIFDSNAGGNDGLYGYGGDDVYYLGAGTGHDAIREHANNSGDAGDEIRLKSGIAVSSVTLERVGVGVSYSSGEHLHIQLRDGNNVITDSLTVEYYYTDASARVESVVFGNGTRWDANQFDVVRIYGKSGDENIYGLADRNDIFDSNAGGNDGLYGYGGDDVYYLGAGTGRDVIREHTNNDGDAGDEIRMKSGIAVSSVTLERVGIGSNSGRDLQVQLRDSNNTITDTLTVEYYYTDASARVESVVFGNGTIWGAAEFDAVRIYGKSGDENIYGLADRNDIFDSNAGGIDNLYGYGGDDVYYFGTGTGRDVIREHTNNDGDAGDEIRMKSGIAVSSVTLERVGIGSNSGRDLQVQLRDSNNTITDTLTVEYYYTDASARVESVVFGNGTIWGAAEFDAVRIYGKSGDENIYGLADRNDIFDSNAGGNDGLYGYGGDDVYYLGAGTGRDVIREHTNNDGDAGDEIRMKSGIAVSSVTLERVGIGSNSGRDLQVQLRDGNNVITDTLTVEYYYTDASARVESVVFGNGTRWDANQFDVVRIYGKSGDENIYGLDDRNDIFDSNAGGIDNLYGYGGDDVYYLGAGTGRDVIREHSGNSGDAGDEIRMKSGIAVSSVTLERVGIGSNSGRDLQVQLRDSNNVITDSLTVEYYYTDASARVESVVFGDGTIWGVAEFDAARIYGGSGNDNIYGTWRGARIDIFDGNAGGDDTLHGYDGNDVYYLGAGTGNDEIREYYYNSGDTGDEIRVKSGFAESQVSLSRDGNDLVVRLMNADGTATADSLRVKYHFSDASAKVEKIRAGGKVLEHVNYLSLASDIAAFNGGDRTKHATMSALQSTYWQDDTTTLTTPA